MTRTAPRLFVDAPLMANIAVPLTSEQTHYVTHVMRLGVGDELVVFNGTEGEWRARLASTRKSGAIAEALQQTRKQAAASDIWLLFAPIKSARIDLIAEKASELGVARLCPVMTKHTQASRVNIERLQAHAVEAAEQCERLDVPSVAEDIKLETALASWPTERRLLVCAERTDAQPLAPLAAQLKGQPLALLVGPEGGFATTELEWLARRPFVTFVTLGPRILRAETACLAALALCTLQE